MEIVRINNNMGKKYKSLLLFGEHPRELITTETSLRLLEKLCQNSESPKIKNILDQYEFHIFPNANPIIRQKVEEGNYCMRENENHVDINRNYDAHWFLLKL